MSEPRPTLPFAFPRIAKLPVDARGYPVPFFVAWIDGKPDFRVMDAAKLRACVKRLLCWICGEPLGRVAAFLIGPMCAVNRVSAEPPSHRDCAEYAAKACPFLTLPKAVRREANLPEERRAPAGVMIPRNPGVALVWLTRSHKVSSVPPRGVLFDLGPPEEVLWYAQGRPATRAEAMESIDSGLPILEEMARKEGPESVAELRRMEAEAMQWVPAR